MIMSPIIFKHISFKNIKLLNETIIIDLVKNNNQIEGVTLLNKDNKKLSFYSNNIVLVAGGYTNNEELFVNITKINFIYAKV